MGSHLLGVSQSMALAQIQRISAEADAQCDQILARIERLQSDLEAIGARADETVANYLAELRAELGEEDLPSTLDALRIEPRDGRLLVSWEAPADPEASTPTGDSPEEEPKEPETEPEA